MQLGHDYTIYPVQADLTTDGVQYSTEVTTTTADTNVAAFSYTFDLGLDQLGSFQSRTTRTLLSCYFDIRIMLGAVSTATADVTMVAQARNKDGTWVNLFDAIEYEDIGTTYLEKTYKGYADLQTNFQEVPFDFQILFQCDETDEGKAKLKNTSYFRAIFKGVN